MASLQPCLLLTVSVYGIFTFCNILLTPLIGYLKGFDVKGLSKYVDYFNFMAYDIHGTWDGKTKWTESDINPHTNLTGKKHSFLINQISLLTISYRDQGWIGSLVAQ